MISKFKSNSAFSRNGLNSTSWFGIGTCRSFVKKKMPKPRPSEQAFVVVIHVGKLTSQSKPSTMFNLNMEFWHCDMFVGLTSAPGWNKTPCCWKIRAKIPGTCLAPIPLGPSCSWQELLRGFYLDSAAMPMVKFIELAEPERLEQWMWRL